MLYKHPLQVYYHLQKIRAKIEWFAECLGIELRKTRRNCFFGVDTLHDAQRLTNLVNKNFGWRALVMSRPEEVNNGISWHTNPERAYHTLGLTDPKCPPKILSEIQEVAMGRWWLLFDSRLHLQRPSGLIGRECYKGCRELYPELGEILTKNLPAPPPPDPREVAEVKNSLAIKLKLGGAKPNRWGEKPDIKNVTYTITLAASLSEGRYRWWVVGNAQYNRAATGFKQLWESLIEKTSYTPERLGYENKITSHYTILQSSAQTIPFDNKPLEDAINALN